MKAIDALQISVRNIWMQRKRSLMVIIVMSIIFGLGFMVNLWMVGMRNSYETLIKKKVGGESVIVEAVNSSIVGIAESKALRATREEMVADIEANGGRVIPDARRTSMGLILPEELVRGMMEVDIATIPDDVVPVLVSTALGERLMGRSFIDKRPELLKRKQNYEEFRKSLIGKTFIDKQGVKYFIAGLTMGNFHIGSLSFRELEWGNEDVLNVVLEQVTVPNGVPIVVDNGREKTWQMKGVDDSGAMSDEDVVVAVFEDSVSVRKYFMNGRGEFMNVDCPNCSYSVNVVAGILPDVEYAVNGMGAIANVILVILGVTAAIVVVSTGVRLVDQDKKNIQLYHELGATSGQVRSIYLCYFLCLMILAVVLAFLVALIGVVAFSVINQELLGVQGMLSFGLAERPKVFWCGVDWTTFGVVVMMLFLALVCVLVNRKRL